MQKCKVLDCPNIKLTNLGLTFHKIPKDPYYNQKWLENLGMEDITQTDNFYVCNIHFDENDFQLDHYNNKKLKLIAVPTKNLMAVPESDKNVFLLSLDAVEKNQSESEDLDDQDDDSDLENKYKHLLLEFEILQDQRKSKMTKRRTKPITNESSSDEDVPLDKLRNKYLNIKIEKDNLEFHNTNSSEDGKPRPLKGRFLDLLDEYEKLKNKHVELGQEIEVLEKINIELKCKIFNS